jgi:hypothetical protein
MKRLIKLSFVLLALLGVLFTSCKKEYEKPPIDPMPIGDSLTIGDILTMPNESTFDKASVFGIVTADEQSGNLYKQIFIQDPETGKAIELVMNTSSAARVGDMVRVFLDSTIVYSLYHNLPQLTGPNSKGFNPDKHLFIYPHQEGVDPIEPQTVTIADIKTGNYTAALVRLKDVEFVEQNVAFCDPGSSTNRHVKDATGEIIVRSSNYANFAYDMLPVGQGSLVAIASVYNNDWQLILRSTRSEDDFNFPGGTPNPPTPGGEVQSMPYSQSFASDFGTYTTYDVLGPQSWFIDYSCAVMKGYDGGNFANEDWLISSPVAIVDVDHAKVAVNYVAQYQNSNAYDVTLQVSTDYVYGDDPTKEATWIQMETTYPNTGGWSDFQTVETSLDDFIGQNVTVAIKFTSSETQSRTFEVKSITVQEGEAGGDTPPTPGTVTGDGSRENPYTANDIILLGIENSDGNKYWVKDYIVGVIDGSYVYQFTSNTDIKTNLIISSNVNANSDTECVPVQLPTGAVREGLNLSDHPGNLGQEVLLYGTLEKYFRVPAVKNVTYAEIAGQGFGNDPGGGGGEPPTQGIFSETFANGQGDFVIKDVNLSGMNYVWAYMNNFHCMKANGYYQSAHETESWLVSPQINLSNVSSATLKFDQAIAFAEGQGSLFIMASTDYSGNVSTAHWTELNIGTWPASNNNWVFETSTADLTSFVGQNVTIAFKYTSTSSVCPAWEVKNIVVE